MLLLLLLAVVGVLLAGAGLQVQAQICLDANNDLDAGGTGTCSCAPGFQLADPDWPWSGLNNPGDCEAAPSLQGVVLSVQASDPRVLLSFGFRPTNPPDRAESLDPGIAAFRPQQPPSATATDAEVMLVLLTDGRVIRVVLTARTDTAQSSLWLPAPVDGLAGRDAVDLELLSAWGSGATVVAHSRILMTVQGLHKLYVRDPEQPAAAMKEIDFRPLVEPDTDNTFATPRWRLGLHPGTGHLYLARQDRADRLIRCVPGHLQRPAVLSASQDAWSCVALELLDSPVLQLLGSHGTPPQLLALTVDSLFRIQADGGLTPLQHMEPVAALSM